MKKILIIGASSGIGKELALMYGKAGDRVGITGRHVDLLTQIHDLYPKNIEIAEHDVCKEKNQEVMERIIDKIGGLDILIISAGIGFINKELQWSLEKQTIDTNVERKPVVYVTKRWRIVAYLTRVLPRKIYDLI